MRKTLDSISKVPTRRTARRESAAPVNPDVTGKTRKSNGADDKKSPTPSRRSSEQRARIMNAAFDSFSDFGYDSASTREIAKRAGASHTKVLYHFGSKENLWIATMEKAVGKYIEIFDMDLSIVSTVSASESLRVFIRDFVIFSAGLPGVHRILSMESTQGSARLDWLINRYLRKHFDTVRDLIRVGQIEGEVRDGDPVRLYYLIISAGAAPFTLSWEYRALTGRDVFSEAEVNQSIDFIYSVIFKRP